MVDVQKSWASTAGTGGRQGVWGISGRAGNAIAYFGVIALILSCPCIAIYLWFALTELDGSVEQLAAFVSKAGFRGLRGAWPQPSLEAWLIFVGFGVFQAALQLLIPGKRFLGPSSPKGNVPVYKANGFQCYSLTLALFFSIYKLMSRRIGLINPGRVYDLFGELLAASSLFSLIFCGFLYVKGRWFPSSSDNGSNDSIVYDYFWGRELYPRIGNHFDLKTWTNCRMGMMSWGILPICWAIKQQQLHGSVTNSMLISVALIEIYVAKFFWWETGYWRTMDIAHDRAGYYLCWGCLVWVPAVYTSQPLYLVRHPHDMPTLLAAANFILGVLSIYINYDSDRQRQVFRATDGRVRVWGRKPKIVTAKYTTGEGKEVTSLLLASGWWGLARHFHYLPEITAAICWTFPCGPAALPWFYVVFLTLLLTDRSFRDDARCRSKYGAYWDKYCKAVPYKMVPLIY